MRASLGILLAVALALGAPACMGQDKPAAGGGPCVDVQVGNERVTDFDCVNRQFRLQAEQAHAAPALSAPLDARSPSTAVGAANQAAAEQTMGSAFGKSARPQRPPPPVFIAPLATPGAH
jgi:hypothetical protein